MVTRDTWEYSSVRRVLHFADNWSSALFVHTKWRQSWNPVSIHFIVGCFVCVPSHIIHGEHYRLVSYVCNLFYIRINMQQLHTIVIGLNHVGVKRVGCCAYFMSTIALKYCVYNVPYFLGSIFLVKQKRDLGSCIQSGQIIPKLDLFNLPSVSFR